eukprot:TRINITY_DN1196_c0_g1_i5.p1 TRINITY_DN1196_c0_g1~~TRINITY_DN1196_c0_g1_i5.p1  ORF type:complete len:231 (+),score=9.33 TRINITY_DN1196_c0_g1_i5:110-802(+)
MNYHDKDGDRVDLPFPCFQNLPPPLSRPEESACPVLSCNQTSSGCDSSTSNDLSEDVGTSHCDLVQKLSDESVVDTETLPSLHESCSHTSPVEPSHFEADSFDQLSNSQVAIFRRFVHAQPKSVPLGECLQYDIDYSVHIAPVANTQVEFVLDPKVHRVCLDRGGEVCFRMPSPRKPSSQRSPKCPLFVVLRDTAGQKRSELKLDLQFVGRSTLVRDKTRVCTTKRPRCR